MCGADHPDVAERGGKRMNPPGPVAVALTDRALAGPMRIAVVHDWLDTWRGGESVLAEILALYPDADLFALVDFLPEALRHRILHKRARTSFLQRLPFARTRFRTFLPLMPRAIESLDVTPYDLVITSSHAVAKGVATTPRQLHICYCHSPIRYAWDLREQYLDATGLGRGVKGAIVARVLDHLQRWDRATSARVTYFVANSGHIRQRIARCYDRDAVVIYPPVDVEFFTPDLAAPRPGTRGYYVTASRWVPYKRVDLIVTAFRALPERRLIVVGNGPQADRVRAAAGSNVDFVGEVPRERLRELLRGARAFLFAAEEDFGILPVEAQACGTPVIAYGRGGVTESVRGLDVDAPTGLFFTEQTATAIADAVSLFESRAGDLRAEACRTNALRFAASRFRREFADFVAARWAAFAARPAA
jgi:glycosyltransferase involved in cell wall biosynthesis